MRACLLNDYKIDTDDEDLGEHTLHLKVLGVTNKDRQNYIECTEQLMNEWKEISVSLVSDEDNPVDPGGIAVNFDTGVGHFGNVCVGYIGNDFKDCMTKY